MQNKALAIIGGGRWGCVTLKVLSKMSLTFAKIIIVSKNNRAVVQELISDLQRDCAIPLMLEADIKAAVADHNVASAIVVNAAPEHYAAAKYLIENGIHVLIEKPITLSTKHTQHLIELSLKNNVCLMPGLNNRFCSYLKNFAATIAERNEKPQTILLEWSDAKNNTRYFDKTTYSDTRTDIAQDLMSHIWAIFSVVFGSHDIVVTGCRLDGNYTEFLMLINKIPTRVVLEQNAEDRKRKLNIFYANNQELILDFNAEPGIIKSESINTNADPEWDSQPRPLDKQYSHFFGLCLQGTTTENDIDACNASTRLVCDASALLQEQKMKQFNLVPD